MTRDLVKNAQKNPHITAKELQKSKAKTYMAELPERSCSYDLNTKWSVQSMQKKTLGRLNPFGTVSSGLTKPTF